VKRIDTDRKTPLHDAATSVSLLGRTVVQVLLSRQADLMATDKAGKTPLHYAASSQSKFADLVVHSLIVARFRLIPRWVHAGSWQWSNVEVKDNSQRRPLHDAAASISVSADRVVHALISRGANVSPEDACAKTPLHYAAGCQSESAEGIVRSLVSHGAVVDATDACGRTPLHYAAAVPFVRKIETLVSANASTTAKDNDQRNALDQMNQSVFSVFDSQLRGDIIGTLREFQIPWYTLDMLPLFKLSTSLSITLEIGFDAGSEDIQRWPDVRARIQKLIDATPLKGIVRISAFRNALSLNAIPCTAGRISFTNGGSDPILMGTLGGVLCMDSSTTYIAITCCHVIPQVWDEGKSMFTVPGSCHEPATMPYLFEIGKLSLNLCNSGPYDFQQIDHPINPVARKLQLPCTSTSEIVDWALLEFGESATYSERVVVTALRQSLQKC
jgi:hypothetical protein